MNISDIKIGVRFRKEIGNIDSLVQSIREVGLLHPIVVSENGELIAGLRRLKACEKLGMTEVPVNVVKLEDLTKGEFHENMVRKDFTISELVAIQRHYEPLVKETRIGHRLTKEEEKKGEESAPFPKGKTRDIVSKFAGVSHNTLMKAEKIVEAAEQEPEKFGGLLEHVDAGETSVHYAYTMIKRAEEHSKPKPLPEGTFNVVYADPPWEYEVPLRGDADTHYQTMKLESICELKVPSAENSILFLWATNPKLQEALTVMKAWGFNYRTNMVWVKDKIGTGYYFRGQHELLLVGTKGNVDVPAEADRVSSVLMAPRQEHSRKPPPKVYELIEQMYPNRHYLELFARNERQGWTAWGNDIGKETNQ